MESKIYRQSKNKENERIVKVNKQKYNIIVNDWGKREKDERNLSNSCLDIVNLLLTSNAVIVFMTQRHVSLLSPDKRTIRQSCPGRGYIQCILDTRQSLDPYLNHNSMIQVRKPRVKNRRWCTRKSMSWRMRGIYRQDNRLYDIGIFCRGY